MRDERGLANNIEYRIECTEYMRCESFVWLVLVQGWLVQCAIGKRVDFGALGKFNIEL